MKKGFTFIELLVSASIFASVLAMSFISLSSVLKTVRASESTRSVAVSGSEAMSKIELFVRNAQPIAKSDGSFYCTNFPNNSMAAAAYAGVSSYGDGTDIAISVPATLKQPLHKIYFFKAYSAGGEDFTLEMLEYQATVPNPTLSNCGYVFAGSQFLLNVNTWARKINNANFFTIQKRPPINRGTVAELDLDPAKVGLADLVLVQVKFKIVQKDSFSGAVVQSRDFQTTITPRAYQSTFSQL